MESDFLYLNGHTLTYSAIYRVFAANAGDVGADVQRLPKSSVVKPKLGFLT